MRGTLAAMLRRALAPALLALAAGACAFPVEGDFAGRRLDPHLNPAMTIVIIHNHGFSSARAGTYRPVTPPILKLAADRNPDVVVFSQVRNTTHLTAVDHSAYIESAVAHFHRARGVPLENIILAGQSCGGWGSLQAVAFSYPTVGGVLGFAPTCHGKLPHSTAVRERRARQPHAGPRALRALRHRQPRRVLGRAIRLGVLREPRAGADRAGAGAAPGPHGYPLKSSGTLGSWPSTCASTA